MNNGSSFSTVCNVFVGLIVLIFVVVLVVPRDTVQGWIKGNEYAPANPGQIEPGTQPPAPEPQDLIPPSTDPPTYQDAYDSITEGELKENLYYLASDELEGRMSGKKGNVTAAAWIKSEFERYGLETAYDRFQIRRMNAGPNNERGDTFTQNVYGWIIGNDPALRDEIIVVGAHMDHIGYGPQMSRSRSRAAAIHPGADDNASGTVALMAVAQAMGILKGTIRRTVVFQAYSGEEVGLIGSAHYCNNPTFPLDNPDIRKHVAMINMDMVGWLRTGQASTASFDSGISSVDINDTIVELGRKYSFAAKITGRRSGGSDHANFYNKRVPIAFLHTGTHPYYHTPGDTADKINYSGLTSVTRYAFDLTLALAERDVAPVFNEADFEPITVTHDHGWGEDEDH